MVKQLGIPTYFLKRSCLDLRWEGFSYVNKLDNLGFKNLSYQDVTC